MYKYDLLVKDLEALRDRGTYVFPIGRSVEGREIFAVRVGHGVRRVFLSGAYHGTEAITAKILIEFIKEAEEASRLLDDSTMYFVPMVNPDGAEIAAKGVYWQANGRGVDINHNFDALWELSKSLEEKNGIDGAGATRFGGDFPESEPETKAIADFTRENNFDRVMALHSQGEVIYYDFCGNVPEGTEDLLDKFEAASRYRREIPTGMSAFGGYKDWFIKKFKKPGFTVEVGYGENPLPIEDFDEIYRRVRGILFAFAER